MSINFPLAASSWEKEELDAMQRVIATGMFTMGENVKAFEQDFAQFVGSKHCVMVNSGSSANLLIIAALFYTKNADLKLQRGDEIIVPAVSWSTTYYPLYQYGLKIKFVDIDLQTLNYDLEQLKLAVTDKTRAIMAVNLLGNPNDFARIQEIIGKQKIVLIEDNCESMGASYNGKQAGTFGIMGSFSSFFSHHISTMEGGLIVTDDEELYQILLSLRAHGWTRNLPKQNLVCSDKSDDSFEESFRFVLPGYNVRPLELEGALGVEQVKRLPTLIQERRKNGALLQAAMKDHPEIIIQREIGESSWFGFSLVIRPGSKLTRKSLVEKLNELGFECRPIVAGNFAKNEVVKYFDCEVHGELKNAEHIDKFGLFVGNHHYSISEAFPLLNSIKA
ncbi:MULTISPECIES: DegT/DnrJ/EryC1/StrS family aminotransferase [unclassified Pseudomonas]|jgi:CDP-6-deoxy-D-xylo-4-hexulose-3-dehydrase|uniref:DegT/DnrJ/EryC1/StrS family aminotransferase n=1 Tax=unclassified Pseudomonas TaxID=196821 RepID=UPI0008AACBD6|nr:MULTISPECIES: DegT/DnrJ/EryC1/StrS family aminotransferase [unclassified Pseudomonas]PMV17892.1 DegT/DnrJ/EryC1/StrS family aminotransferase [Pseudomonas sp. FW305-3-2-15-C-TSA2]PMV24110.1 DegT/DnrJ/EryC1/StrS family aminotransferase [Pseudomonas sp. DP16D-L5]PMV37604.1 DegT/DnrJ/EryC1/StrS family aminotransferase [Pseudomonas sp. FW305-3-2-15-A-LB2]PMV42096.1 DegT/DnrJ/EryC1/StrS family aminotransferase [Pseudomonas sp. FW305-3-2-15-C-R2A1]PMV47946.1 DegT/DnrJ/EryC1/StrS family aminotransf